MRWLISILERLAVRLRPYRWRLALVTAATSGALFLAGYILYLAHVTLPPWSGPLVKAVFGVAWAVITASWWLFLCVSWFHPEFGALRHRSSSGPVMHRFRVAERLVAAMSLAFGVVVIPLPLAWLL